MTNLYKIYALLFLGLFCGKTISAQSKLTGPVIGEPGDGLRGQANVFDGSITDFFDVGGDPPPGNQLAGAGLILDGKFKITKIRFYPRADGGSAQDPWPAEKMLGGKFQGANNADFSDSVTLYTITALPPLASWSEVDITDTASFQYVRYLAPDLSGAVSGPTASNGNVAEVEFYGTAPDSSITSGKSIFIPDEWKIASNDIEWDSVNRMKQSANCVVFWGPLAGNDPTQASNTALRFDPQKILDSMESVYRFHMDSLREIPDSGQWAKYKLMVIMNNTWRDGLYTGFAFGGGFDNKAPAMFVDPSVFADNAWVVTHEMTHAIQAMIPNLYPGHGFNNTNSGYVWETDANFMALQRYPTFITATDMPRFMNMSDYFIGSGRKHYGAWQFLQLFKDDYGINFISRLWKEADNSSAETPLQTAQRLLGMDHESFNNYLFKMAVKSVKWDFSNKEEITAAEASLDRMYKFRKTVILDSLSDGHYAIPDALAPQQYGFNIIRLYPQAEEGCNTPYVYLKFKGHEDTNAASGWRYAFVTLDSTTNQTIYSDFHSESSGEVIYKLPANTSETYLVVMGAPTEFKFQAPTVFEPGFPKIYRYPWEIQIQGAIPEGYEPGYRSIDTAGLSGSRHTNGGGWVANTASVDASVYVAPHAYVLDRARVIGNARIEGKAEIRDDAVIQDNTVVKDFAVVGGTSKINGNATIQDRAYIYYSTVSNNAVISENVFLSYNTITGNAKIFGNAFSTGSTNLGDSIQIGGDAEIGGTCSAGKYLQCIGVAGRTECDGRINDTANIDINASYTNFTDGEMSLSNRVVCGDSVGKATHPPVITLDSAIQIQLPVNSVSIIASAIDPDGSISSYSWKEISGPSGYTISSPNQASTNIYGLQEGVYIFGLTAVDNSGSKTTAKIKITVLIANDPAIVDAGNKVTISLPTDYVTLVGSAQDLDGYIKSVKWSQAEGNAGAKIVSPGSNTSMIEDLQLGEYKFVFSATDNSNETSADTVTVTVLANNAIDNSNSNLLNVSPVPANNIVTVNYPISVGGYLSVFSSKGSKMIRKALIPGTTSTSFSVSGLSNGVYYIRIDTNNKDKYKLKLLVTH